jgi:hypothetical protein
VGAKQLVASFDGYRPVCTALTESNLTKLSRSNPTVVHMVDTVDAQICTSTVPIATWRLSSIAKTLKLYICIDLFSFLYIYSSMWTCLVG